MAAGTWLNPGEDIVVDVRPHWSFLGRPLVAVVVLLAGAIAAVARHAPGALDDVLAVLVILSLLWLVGRYARWATTAMILTNERLVQRRGVLSRRVRELPLAQIGEVDCRRRVWDRLLGSGDVVVTSVSAGREVFEHLPRPTGIVKELHRQIDLAGRARWDGAGSAAEQLGKLDDLRRRGAISQAEFDEHRERFLGQW
ncbi:MAG: PH domain-containing protein [Actinomycetota bacterium]|nr:PH domain-containing protein [Actinomycetota bacterium]